VQLIRTCAILQLLLGNIGRPGGGILALRGHAAIQGSTDTPTLYNLLPGYMEVPLESEPTLDDYLAEYTAEGGWWHNFPKYIVSLLKSWYGDAATQENEFAYQYLPKLHEQTDYSYYPMMFGMVDRQIEGLFVMGENFAVGGPASILERQALRSLKWCVVRDPVHVETADFWDMDGVDPASVETEVIYMPAAWAAEKSGSLTNTQRLLQWHDQAVDPPGDCRSETWFMYHLGRRLKELYAGSAEERDQPLLKLTWDYPVEEALEEPRALAVLQEMNGYRLADHTLLSGYKDLQDNGGTSCGNWIYSGVTPAADANLAAARQPDRAGAFSNHQHWGFAWPNNRRILYNRCSADQDGRPWSERKRLIWWDAQAAEGKGQWVGYDVPDFELHKAPQQPPDTQGAGMAALSGADPFIMHADGKGWLFVPHALRDGPLPVHYEPVESPMPNLLYPNYPHNPTAVFFERPDNPYNGAGNPEYPYVITTYRLTEHHTSGAMSRWNTWLAELQPALFAEIDLQLAAEKRLQTGDWVTVSTARGAVEARAMVTARMRPLIINGRTIHVVGMPYHWGPGGVVTGDIVNDLIGVVLDPNVRIHEAKAFTCNLRKGRKGQKDGAHGAENNEVATRTRVDLHAELPEGGIINRFGSEGAEMLHRTSLAER
jgi:formate dehydrogenase major subunit